MSLIGHYSLSTEHLPPAKKTHLIEYWTASNGVFVRAKREGLEAVIPVCSAPLSPLKMLYPLRPDIRLAGPRVSQDLVLEMFMQSLHAQTPQHEPAEILFHLYYLQNQWQISIPDQEQSKRVSFLIIDPDLLEDYPYPDYRERIERLTVILGCTDNAAARRSIFNVLEANRSYEAPRFWVLDCGNVAESGQVLLGSAHTVEAMRHAFKFTRQCIALPSPALQAPDLLVPRPEEREHPSLSCAEMAVANAQSLMMNCALAYEAADYLLRMLITGTLKRYATYIDLPSGRKTSSYITPESLARTLGKDASFFLKK